MLLRTITTICLLVLVAGCDRHEASTSAPPSSPPAPPSAEARYDTFRQTAKPVVDELYGVESLIEHANTMDLQALATQVKAVNSAYTKINGNFTDEDKNRDSYKAMMIGMEKAVKAYAVWQKSEDIKDSMSSNTDFSEGLKMLDAVREGRKIKTDLLVDAEIEIVKMKDLLANKR